MLRFRDSSRVRIMLVLALVLVTGPGCRREEPLSAQGSAPDAHGGCPPGMAFVPGGTFEMGSWTGFPDESPPQRVHVDGFCLDVTEVTVGAYRRCVAADRCAPLQSRAVWPEIFTLERESWSQFCNARRSDRDDHPANCIEWGQAENYCRAHGWRLPTEAEFEYAARGGDEQRTYPWGEQDPDPTRLNACGTECSEVIGGFHGGWRSLYDQRDRFVGTSPVGSFPEGRGRWGHLDLAGNVWEWTSTLYCPYDSPGCYSDERVVRGSGFLQTNRLKTRATRRNQDVEWHSSGDSGFRCATSIGPNPPRSESAPAFTLMHQLPGTPRWGVLLIVAMTVLGGVGWILGLLGGGGSVLTLPVLLLVVGFEQRTATAMSLTVMAATSIVSTAAHARRKAVAWKIALPFAAATIVGALVGGRLAPLVPGPLLLAGFVIVMGITAHRMLRPDRRNTDPSTRVIRAGDVPKLALFGIVVGVISGLLGVGGGFLVVPVLVTFGAVPVAIAVGTSTFVIACTMMMGLVAQGAYRIVDWPLFAAFAVASVIGTLLGSRRTATVSPAKLRRWFGTMVVVAGGIVLARQVIPGIRELMSSRSQVAPSRRGDRG